MRCPTSARVQTLDGGGCIRRSAARRAHPCMTVLGALPLLLYAAFRRYLQGMHVVRPVMFALITANLVNAAPTGS